MSNLLSILILSLASAALAFPLSYLVVSTNCPAASNLLNTRMTMSVKQELATPRTTGLKQEPKLLSEVGVDYVPLVNALKSGHFEVADQLTRDLILEIGGEKTRQQGFVYFAQVKNLPLKDLQTIDNLWVAFSGGRFGYSVQKKIWNSKKVSGDFNKFVQEVEWTLGPCGGCEGRPICSGCTGTLKRWAPIGSSGNEFSYDVKGAKGHLPLTSALRGTYLLENILKHPAFGFDDLAAKFSVKASMINEDVFENMKDLRFPVSPYLKNKAKWDV